MLFYVTGLMVWVIVVLIFGYKVHGWLYPRSVVYSEGFDLIRSPYLMWRVSKLTPVRLDHLVSLCKNIKRPTAKLTLWFIAKFIHTKKKINNSHKMDKLLEIKLEVLRDFQKQYPTAHVGGSIGLFLRGVDLHRDLNNSDLDITIDCFKATDAAQMRRVSEASDSTDFDYALGKDVGGLEVKLDLRICPKSVYDVVEFEGLTYNVSKYDDIIHWKTKYALEGVKKHQQDLETIKIGIRHSEFVTTFSDDTLPIQ